MIRINLLSVDRERTKRAALIPPGQRVTLVVDPAGWLAPRVPDAPWSELSMGMTDDFALAIAAGATLVRIGRAIFGERPAGD